MIGQMAASIIHITQDHQGELAIDSTVWAKGHSDDCPANTIRNSHSDGEIMDADKAHFCHNQQTTASSSSAQTNEGMTGQASRNRIIAEKW